MISKKTSLISNVNLTILLNQVQHNQHQVEQCFMYPIACLIDHKLTLICIKNQLESAFIEIINSKKSNIVVGCVYNTLI